MQKRVLKYLIWWHTFKVIIGSRPQWGHLRLDRELEPIEFFSANFGKEVEEQLFPVALSKTDLCNQISTKFGINYSNPMFGLVVWRGNCSFAEKAINAVNLGVSKLIIINTEPGLFHVGGAENQTQDFENITIVLISRRNGWLIENRLNSFHSTATANFVLRKVEEVDDDRRWKGLWMNVESSKECFDVFCLPSLFGSPLPLMHKLYFDQSSLPNAGSKFLCDNSISEVKTARESSIKFVLRGECTFHEKLFHLIGSETKLTIFVNEPGKALESAILPRRQINKLDTDSGRYKATLLPSVMISFTAFHKLKEAVNQNQSISFFLSETNYQQDETIQELKSEGEALYQKTSLIR
eukprot:snap_masked-scaffold_42-processed-gene-2.1-mRNA-1 protein AED:1.00 eAED:1.00 QI:0/0/0/0/1/1/2/0/352